MHHKTTQLNEQIKRHQVEYVQVNREEDYNMKNNSTDKTEKRKVRVKGSVSTC